MKTTRTTSLALKAALATYCARHALKSSRDYAIGRACLLTKKGLFVLEVTVASTSPHSPGAVGFRYPAGVRHMTDAAMTVWLASN